MWSQRSCCEAVASLVLFADPAIHNGLNHSQKQWKVRKMYFTSDVAVVYFLRK